MDIAKLKFVVGKCEEGEAAVIRFFGPVDSYNTQCFNDEFLWLQNSVKPSKIVVLINSEGGSVLYGMSTFSVLQSCPIKTQCIVEGMAASMGSVIWSAGNELFMHDYSILMMHNPFFEDKCDDPNTKAMVEHFKGQIETIYQKRFGFTKDKVRCIMDGEEDVDGTYFSAKEAVAAGIIPAENIIKTSKSIREQAKNEIDGITDIKDIREAMNKICASVDETKLVESIGTIHQQKITGLQDNKKMEENENNISFAAVSAQLGFQSGAKIADVTSRIVKMQEAEAKVKDLTKCLEETKNSLSEMQIKLTGKETELKNVNTELSGVKAELQKYQDAEKAKLEAEKNSVIEAAVNAGKIEASDKENWMKMADANFELVKNTLGAIPARQKITEEISGNAQNIRQAQEGKTKAELDLESKVKDVLKEEIELKKF